MFFKKKPSIEYLAREDTSWPHGDTKFPFESFWCEDVMFPLVRMLTWYFIGVHISDEENENGGRPFLGFKIID